MPLISYSLGSWLLRRVHNRVLVIIIVFIIVPILLLRLLILFPSQFQVLMVVIHHTNERILINDLCFKHMCLTLSQQILLLESELRGWEPTLTPLCILLGSCEFAQVIPVYSEYRHVYAILLCVQLFDKSYYLVTPTHKFHLRYTYFSDMNL